MNESDFTSQCPHCGKSGGSSNMKRYHFDNCLNNHNLSDEKKTILKSKRALSESVKTKIKTNSKGVKHKKQKHCICIYCGFGGRQGDVKRYHNDNCKHRESS